jgi:hypothetical protein
VRRIASETGNPILAGRGVSLSGNVLGLHSRLRIFIALKDRGKDVLDALRSVAFEVIRHVLQQPVENAAG